VRADRLSAQKELACLRAYSSVQPPPPAFFVTILSDIWIIPSFVSSNFLTEAYMDSRLADIFWVGSAWHAASSSVMQPTAGLPPGSSDMPSLLSAFGQEAAIYLGGPDAQGEGALLVHGLGALDGVTELAPGTRIFTGGVQAAVAAVLAGDAKPLDFRWFVGCQSQLDVTGGAWRPLAVSRTVALKQCIGLPKPLWHEVMELAGGELARWSRVELLKRTDLAAESSD